jgi:hypothetical protein
MRKFIISLALLVTVLSGGRAVATAAEVSYPLDEMFRPIPIEVPALALVSLTDIGSGVRVDLTNLAEGRLDSLYFNFNGDPYNRDPDDLRITNVTLDGSQLSRGSFRTFFARSENGRNPLLRTPGGGFFDAVIDMTPGNALRIGETLSFDLGINGVDLSIADFELLSLPGSVFPQTFVFASQIFGPDGGSVWVGGLTPVPLPASFLLFGTSLIGLLAISRMKLFAAA